MVYKYPSHLEFVYDTTREYRHCVRSMFNMDVTRKVVTINEDEPLDDETLDELDYDPEACVVTLDCIYAATKHNFLFKELYTAAAAKMLSTDLEIGLTVLLSYDHLARFHKCLVCFFETPTEFTRNSECFLELYTSIG